MVNLKLKKELAARTLGVGTDRIWFDPDALDDLEMIDTREDVRAMADRGFIKVKPVRGQTTRPKESKGPGSRKGKKTAKLSRKRRWIQRVRAQRKLLRRLKEEEKVTGKQYRDLYNKVKGGSFKSVKHLKDYVEKTLERED